MKNYTCTYVCKWQDCPLEPDISCRHPTVLIIYLCKTEVGFNSGRLSSRTDAYSNSSTVTCLAVNLNHLHTWNKPYICF